MKDFVRLLSLLLLGSTPGFATIWADLDSETVTGRNDGVEDVFITKEGRSVRIRHKAAADPLKGEDETKRQKTVRMTSAGKEYYLKEFKKDIAREKAFRLGDQNRLSDTEYEAWQRRGDCPPGKNQYRKTALFGLIKGRKICLSDYELESLRAQQRRDLQNTLNNIETQRKLDNIEANSFRPKFVTCNSSRFGSYMSVTCY